MNDNRTVPTPSESEIRAWQQEELRQIEKQLAARTQPAWKAQFTERELKEIAYCQLYQRDFAHGTDGHNIRLIVAKLAAILDGNIPSK